MAQYPAVHETDTKKHSGTHQVNKLCICNVHLAIMSQTSCPWGSHYIVVVVPWKSKMFSNDNYRITFLILALVSHFWSRRVHRPSISICSENYYCGACSKRALQEHKKCLTGSDQQPTSSVSKGEAVLEEYPSPSTFCCSFSLCPPSSTAAVLRMMKDMFEVILLAIRLWTHYPLVCGPPFWPDNAVWLQALQCAGPRGTQPDEWWSMGMTMVIWPGVNSYHCSWLYD